MSKIFKKYVPKSLTKEDAKKQTEEIKKSREEYKKGKYHDRDKVKSYKSHPSHHLSNAKSIYKVEKISASAELAKKTGCSVAALKKIIKKGEGAFYSSGSRPNQTSQSWGHARLASAISGGKASVVDFKIIEEGCSHNGMAYKLALEAKNRTKKKNT